VSAPGIAAPTGAQERRPWWRGWLDAIAAYRHPRVLAMLFLGFSAGLPFMLVFTTLSAWLRELGIDRTTIGMLSWVGLAYTLKFFWAPVVDRLRLPVLGRFLGRRRSWMLLAQIGIALGLVNIAHTTPVGHLGALAGFALLVAFSSATQDIAIDAWRIEAAPQPMQGVMAAAYQLGYRIAIMVASAGALWIAADHGFSAAYIAMAAMVGIGIVTTLLIPEPEPRVPTSAMAQEQRVVAWLERNAHLPASLRDIGAWFTGAVVCPFVDFFSRYGTKLGLLILVFAASYRLTDFTMGVMANPFYIDVGYTLKEIAAVAKGFGLIASIVGVLIGGVVVARLGTVRSLVLGSLLVIASNLMFMTLAWTSEPSLAWLALVVSADNLAMGVAGTALIAYLSSLTSPGVHRHAVRTFLLSLRAARQAPHGWIGFRRRSGGLSVVLHLYVHARSAGARAAVVGGPAVASGGERAAPGVVRGVRAGAPAGRLLRGFGAALVCLLSMSIVATAGDAAGSASAAAPKVIAYVTGWSPPVSIDTSRITHVNFAFARIDGQGRVVLPDEASATRLAEIVALKRMAPALRVLISVGGWGAEGFSDAALTDESRARFADSAVELMHSQAADGIDLDWSTPGKARQGYARARRTSGTLHCCSLPCASASMPGRGAIAGPHATAIC
jgi:PAT family beta-lactamase induction signal transducer AmpG